MTSSDFKLKSALDKFWYSDWYNSIYEDGFDNTCGLVNILSLLVGGKGVND